MDRTYTECKIDNIVWHDKSADITSLSFEVLDSDGEKHLIQIQNSNAADQLTELKCGARSQAILAFGMTDIDIWRLEDGNYRIEWSPTESIFLNFFVSNDAMQVLFDSLNTIK